MTDNTSDKAKRISAQLAELVGKDKLVETDAERMVYEADAYTIDKRRPAAVVHATSTEDVQAVVRFADREGIPFVARGAGTGLSGGALPQHDGIIISLASMRRILNVDIRNRRLTAQAGAVNMQLTRDVTRFGYHYAPDPSSGTTCTIGGNVAENAGGPHTLKYGVTTNHILGLKMVLPDGELLDIPGDSDEPEGYDLMGLITGSEGTFGIVTEVTVKLTRNPEAYHTSLAVFETLEDAGRCVSEIIGAGIIPTALELMDTAVIHTVEAAFHFGFPEDAGAVLIIELDGLEAGLALQGEHVKRICEANNAREVRVAATDEQRDQLWLCRKKAVGTLGRIAPSHCTMDGVVPRSKLPQMLREAQKLGEKHNLVIANVSHAGDGNLHPLVLFDERDAEEVRRVLEYGHDVLKACVDLGGTITGEHGVGVEKQSYMTVKFSENDLATMGAVKSVFDPRNLCNPNKLLPCAPGQPELAPAQTGPGVA